MFTEMYLVTAHLHAIKLYNLQGQLISKILYDDVEGEYDVSDEVNFTIKTYKVG